MTRRLRLSDALEAELERLEAEIELCARRCTESDRGQVELLLAEFLALKERASMFISRRQPRPDRQSRSPMALNIGPARTVVLTTDVSAVFLRDDAGWRFDRWELAATATRHEVVVTTPSAEDCQRSFETLEAAVDHFRDRYLPVAETGT